MRVFHYKHVNSDDNYHHSLTSDFGKTNTDKTFYRPSLDALRSTLGGSLKVGLYDFPDGKDTGERYQPILRNRGIDITEVNQILDNIKGVISDKKTVDKQKLEEAIEKAKKDAEIKDASAKAHRTLPTSGSESSSN